MIDQYDREGKPISMDEYVRLLTIHGEDYKRVAFTQVGPYAVSTVWLGINHNWGGGPPLIFETMVFASGEWGDTDREPRLHDMDCHRWSTEAEANAGHEEIVTLIRATVQEEMLDVDPATGLSDVRPDPSE